MVSGGERKGGGGRVEEGGVGSRGEGLGIEIDETSSATAPHLAPPHLLPTHPTLPLLPLFDCENACTTLIKAARPIVTPPWPVLATAATLSLLPSHLYVRQVAVHGVVHGDVGEGRNLTQGKHEGAKSGSWGCQCQAQGDSESTHAKRVQVHAGNKQQHFKASNLL